MREVTTPTPPAERGAFEEALDNFYCAVYQQAEHDENPVNEPPGDVVAARAAVIAAKEAEVAGERERCAVIADGGTLSSEKCRTDAGCDHRGCVTARLIADEIRGSHD